jgi:DNA-directed RNA polymerase specialized sigma24 family protein
VTPEVIAVRVMPSATALTRTPCGASSSAAVRTNGQQVAERQRTVLVLRDVEGWAAEEVCTLLDVSTGNQRVLHRVRAAVRSTLDSRHSDLHLDRLVPV